MIRIQFFLIFLLLPLTMRSQEDICIGKRYSLDSAFLQEERDYWIYLPQNYDRDTTQNYPVIYLLDGGSFFHSLVGISQTLSTVKGKYLPSCIIAGVISTDRTRDFTPTASAAALLFRAFYRKHVFAPYGIIRYLFSPRPQPVVGPGKAGRRSRLAYPR